MASKSSSPGPNATTAPAPKPTRSRKAAAPNVEAGRAGSAGGILLDKANVVKPKSTPSAPTTSNDSPIKTPRRKPRKLNKDPTSTSTPPVLSSAPAQPPTASEIEALKARVRGLEAKVEELYKSGSLERPGRSPRRRGKGRKGSSAVQVPTLASTKANDEEDDVEEIGRGDGREGEGGVEELVRLEGELESARQDLAAFRPRQTRKDEEDDVEEIEREDMGREKANRHVTLSGSYRIPLPASVSVDDVRQIQSGVSAAQNVARSFLEQRRAAATLNSSQDASIQSTAKAKAGRPVPKSVSSSMEVVPIDEEGGKKSWSEWIGGYSVAISRAVRNIEHEAGVESQPAGGNGTTGGSGGGGRGWKKKKVAGTGKRPGVKTRISGEQVEGLMS